jgi:hypothetical protein
VLVLTEVLGHGEAEAFLLGAGPLGELAVAEGGEFEVVLALAVEVPGLLLAEEGFQEVEAVPSSLEGGLFALLALDLAIGVETLGGDDVLDDCWKETGDHLEDNILHLLPSLLLALPFLLPLGYLFDLLRLLFRLQLFLQALSGNIYIFDVNIGGILEGIDLPDCCLDLIVELMRADALQDAEVVVSEDDVALGVQLEDEVVREGLRPEGNHHYSLHTHLPHAIHAFRPEKFPEAHGEAGRDGLLIRFLFSEVEAHPVFNQQLVLLLRFSDLEDIGSGAEIVYIGDS